MPYLLRPETAAKIVNMISDGTINQATATKLKHYYEAKRRIEIGQGTKEERKADIRYLCDFHNIRY